MQGSLWALACLLSIWSSESNSGQAPDVATAWPLDSMAPLYPAARRVASSLRDPAACLRPYVDLLQQGASLPDRYILADLHAACRLTCHLGAM